MAETYPLFPGWKGGETSRIAAKSVAPKAPTLQARVLDALSRRPMTPEEAALFLRVDVFSIRPRFSELRQLGKIEETGERRRSRGGKLATVWRLA